MPTLWDYVEGSEVKFITHSPALTHVGIITHNGLGWCQKLCYTFRSGSDATEYWFILFNCLVMPSEDICSSIELERNGMRQYIRLQDLSLGGLSRGERLICQIQVVFEVSPVQYLLSNKMMVLLEKSEATCCYWSHVDQLPCFMTNNVQ